MSNGGDYGVYNNSISTLERALKERVLLTHDNGCWKPPMRPSVEEFSGRTNQFTQDLRKHIRFSTPMQPVAFALTYQGRKRTMLLNAIKRNEEEGFHDYCAVIKAFVKHEKYLFSTTKTVIPRLIQPRDHRYIVETGRYIKPIEKLIYKGVNALFGSVTVFKGLNMRHRGNLLYSKWARFKKPVAVSIDVSKFDKHVSNAALSWEHSIYEKYYPGDSYFSRLMGLQRNNRGKASCADGYLTYHTRHNRASGDSNTSLGNVLLMCALVYDYLILKMLDAEVADDGDDCVLILEEKDLIKLKGLKQWFGKAGFPLVTEEPVDVFERIVFCQAQPVRDQYGGYTMVRDPRKSLGKDAVALKPLDNRKIKEMWMAAVGDGGMALTSGMPVLQEYYSCYKRNSNGAAPLKDTTMEGGFFRLGLGMSSTYVEPSPESRFSFWLAFDITPSEQICLEQYYRKLTLTHGELGNRYNLLPY